MEHDPASLGQHASHGDDGFLGPLLGFEALVAVPHLGVVSDGDPGGLDERHAEPAVALLGDAAVIDGLSRGIGGGHEPGVSSQLVARGEAVDTIDLDGDYRCPVHAQSRQRAQQLDVGIGRDLAQDPVAVEPHLCVEHIQQREQRIELHAASEPRELVSGEQQGRADGGAAVDSVLAKRALRKRDDQPQLARTGPTRLDGSGQVLVVGDSLEVLTSPYLKRYLPGIPLTVNAEGGYNSIQIFGLFEESFDPAQSVIVFDAGTNDNPAYPEILAGNLDKVAATAGDRCLVVPTIHGFTVDGVDNTGKNRVVRSFAANHPTTQVPDWARAVELHPELMQSDDLHPIPEGADLRARMIARGVKACLAMDPRFVR